MKARSLFLFIICLGGSICNAALLEVELVPRINGKPLALDHSKFVSAAGETIAVTRLDFLMSDLALRRPDGSWVVARDWQRYMSVGETRTLLRGAEMPGGKDDAVRFHIGLKPEVNHRPPAMIAAGDPLYPAIDTMHWNWQGGFIFFAIEGRWHRNSSEDDGYSFHIGNDRELMNVELPVALDLTSGPRTLRVAIDVERIFEARHSVRIASAKATHSRERDSQADDLRDNVEQAFHALDLIVATTSSDSASRTASLPPGAIPYRFTFSRVFPVPELPRDNPLTEQGVRLGERLFNENRLSINSTQSCATCHQSAHAFTDSSRRVSLSAEGASGTRNAMTLFNLAWKKEFFWDGRASSLREQVLQPIQRPLEMHETLSRVVQKLGAIPAYGALFEQTFGTSEITSERVALALEQFLLTRVSCKSKFDRAFAGTAQLTDEEKRGFELFSTEHDPRTGQFGADCFHCHGGADFTNHRFANNGLDSEPADAGRFSVTQNEADRGKFAVPSLRNVALTAPYMHDGRFATLEEVIAHYDHGVKRCPTLDPNIAKHPPEGLGLSESDQHALIAFLKALTDESLLP